MARNLRIQRTGAIGVLIPLDHENGQQISDPFFITMLGLLTDALSTRGYDLLLSRVSPGDGTWLERYVDSGRVDGVIVIGQSGQSAVLDAMAARYRPLVVWGANQPGQVHCSVGTDNHRGGELAVEHLLARGARNIAFVGDPNFIEIGQRLEGCRAAMARAGLADRLCVVPASVVAEVAHRDIARSPDATLPDDLGIVAASDVIAVSALRVLADMGRAVPGDVRVIGYDGLAMGEHTVPRLSTIRQDLPRGAALLVEMLLRRIGGEDTPSVVMEPELVVRSSS
jgi:DNA-binding LacI/PurR family transcriptional regulator